MITSTYYKARHSSPHPNYHDEAPPVTDMLRNGVPVTHADGNDDEMVTETKVMLIPEWAVMYKRRSSRDCRPSAAQQRGSLVTVVVVLLLLFLLLFFHGRRPGKVICSFRGEGNDTGKLHSREARFRGS